MSSYTRVELEAMLDGKMPWEKVQEIIKNPKDTTRFEDVVNIFQDRVNFKEKILLPLTPKLYIVQKGKERVIKCGCGQEYGDYRVNWKLYSLIYVRDTQETLDEVYPGLHSLDPRIVQIREYYCPGCATQLEVEALPRGVPADFEFLPDLDTFYRHWLGKVLPEEFEHVDKTGEVLKHWAK